MQTLASRPVDLCAVLSMQSELSPRTQHNQNNRHSPVFNTLWRTLRTDTRMCSPLEEQATTTPSLDRSRFHRTEVHAVAASVSSTVLYSASCRRSDEVTFLTLGSKKMWTKSSPNDDEEVLQLSEAIIRCVKWSYKCPVWERSNLKKPRFLKSSKTTF